MFANKRKLLATPFAAVGLAVLTAVTAPAQSNPFAPGWQLGTDASALRFQSVKNNKVVETSSFATFGGTIDESGQVTIKVLLDSVDTKVDLRNVRMRFLFFETFQFPEAVISTRIERGLVEELRSVRRKVVPLPFTLTLHGVTQAMEAEVAVTLLDENTVSVSSFTPLQIAVANFNLEPGIKKLEEAANVQIVPTTSVTFDLLFSRTGSANGVEVASRAPLSDIAPTSTAVEAKGDFSLEACKGRFEILSRTDNIYFPSGSARLDSRSQPLLDSIVDVVNRCPGLVIEVSGHTDSDGNSATNQRLSEARASSVTDYLTGQGVDRNRIVSVGHGESRPVVPNTSRENMRRNRRIEFAVVGG